MENETYERKEKSSFPRFRILEGTSNKNLGDNEESHNEENNDKGKIMQDLIFQGELIEGKPNGPGVCENQDESVHFRGLWKDGKKHGRGCFITENWTFEGIFFDDYPLGECRFTFKNGTILEGIYVPKNICGRENEDFPTVWFETMLYKQTEKKSMSENRALEDMIKTFEEKLKVKRANKIMSTSSKEEKVSDVELIDCQNEIDDKLNIIECVSSNTSINIIECKNEL
ncbi:hypothetical protein ACOME3_003147 [Neoechinorhynchus agilis]